MTKEQIEKHGEVIKWFINNPSKGVWCRRNDTGLQDWVLTYEPDWESFYVFIRNDEYAEFRKALVDNKDVEYSLKNCEQWNIVENTIQHFSKAFKYRIKPDEPKFAIGDWIVTPNNRVHQFKAFSGDKYGWNTSLDYENLETLSGIRYHIKNYDRSIIKKWKPKDGEIVCGYNDDENIPSIGKYSHYRKAILVNIGSDELMVCAFDNIGPLEFIQTLKH